MERKKYVKPCCRVCRVETVSMLADSFSTLKVNRTPSNDFVEGAANRNNGWELW